MIRYLAEDLVFLLIKSKVLNIELYETYLYAMEILILNGALLLSSFIFSLILGGITHYFFFLLFFVPMRMFSGGYHCKTSELCFFCSMGLYMSSFLFVKALEYVIVCMIMIIVVCLLMILILIRAPLVNKRHPLDVNQIKRNRKILLAIVLLDFILSIIFIHMNSRIILYEICGIFFAQALFVMEMVRKKRDYRVMY